MEKNRTLLPLWALVTRNVKMFMKDKLMVFFSILAPVIVLLLYILFLGEMQIQNVQNVLSSSPEFAGFEVSAEQVRAVINNWMIAGVMSVSCVTVTLSCCTIMVRDRERGAINDVLAAPIPRWVLYLSYMISCFIITFTICFAVLMISIIYLACSGGLLMSFVDFLAILGVTVISILSSALFMTLIVSFIRTEGALTSFNSVFSAAIGFLIGAYIPVGMMPQGVQYLCLFIPGTYSAGLFRNLFLAGPINVLGATLGVDRAMVNQLLADYSVDMNFFGMSVSPLAMVLVLIGSIMVFGSLILIFYSNKKTNFFAVKKKKKKVSKK